MRHPAAVLPLVVALLGSGPAAARSAPPSLALERRSPIELASAEPDSENLPRDAAFAAGVSGLGFLLDDTIEPGSGEDTVYDNAGDAMGNFFALSGATGLFALHAWATDNERNLDAAHDVALALGATAGTVVLLKATIHRERPDGSDDNSFPSGHAANSFAVATVLERHYGGAVGWISYAAAAFIASSRVIGNHHWLSDVMTGASIGFLWGRFVTSRD